MASMYIYICDNDNQTHHQLQERTKRKNKQIIFDNKRLIKNEMYAMEQNALILKIY